MALDGRELDDLLGIARRAVGEAAALLRTVDPAAIGRISSKSNPRDLVTEWDARIEELIRGRLDELSPGIAILGEEGGSSGQGAGAVPGLRWLVDPVDGTVNFSHGVPHYGVTIALEEGAVPVVGVIAAPRLGWETWARRGGGAFGEDGRPLAVSRTSELERAMLTTGFPYDRATSRANFAEWDHMQCVTGACRRFGAASLDLMMVARGWMDGYWEAGIEAWDLAAGAVIVEEAGGRVTGVTGAPFLSDEGHVLATNGAIHDVVLRELAAARSTRIE